MNTMVQKLKETLSPDWLRAYNSVLLTFSLFVGGFVLWYVKQLNDKVEVSDDFRIQQKEINIHFHEKFNGLYKNDVEIIKKYDYQDARIAEVSERQWTFQNKTYERLGRIDQILESIKQN